MNSHSHLQQQFQSKGNQVLPNDKQFPSTEAHVVQCEEFQKKITQDYIQKVWGFLSESNQSNETSYYNGRKLIKKEKVKSLFDQNMGKENSQIIEAFLKRFQCLEQPEYIDIQDLVVSLTILSRMSDEHKLRLIFDLTDVDQDECLSIDDIHNMIKRIQRNFARETIHIDVASSSMLNELALIAADRKFQITMDGLVKRNLSKEGQKIEEASNDDNRFISWTEFYECLSEKKSLSKSFLPNNYLMSEVLKNTFIEKDFELGTQDVGDFKEFRKMLHFGLRSHYKEKDYMTFVDPKIGVPLPGKIIQSNPKHEKHDKPSKVSQFEVEKINDAQFKKNLDDLSSKRVKLVQSEAQKKIEKIMLDEEKHKQMNKETNQTNNTERHKQRVQEMINFNKDPKYNEQFFKKQIEQMKAKQNKLLRQDTETDKRKI